MKEILISISKKIRPPITFQNVVLHEDQNIRKRNNEASSVERRGNEGGIETEMARQGNEYRREKVGRICKR